MKRTTISVQELSAQMGISLPKAYELVKTPEFPALRIGTRILISVDAYKNWLMSSPAETERLASHQEEVKQMKNNEENGALSLTVYYTNGYGNGKNCVCRTDKPEVNR